jgi:hypothetical protein
MRRSCAPLAASLDGRIDGIMGKGRLAPIIFAQMLKSGVRGNLLYCCDRKCNHTILVGAPSRLADRKRDAEGRSTIGVLCTNRPSVSSHNCTNNG